MLRNRARNYSFIQYIIGIELNETILEQFIQFFFHLLITLIFNLSDSFFLNLIPFVLFCFVLFCLFIVLLFMYVRVFVCVYVSVIFLSFFLYFIFTQNTFQVVYLFNIFFLFFFSLFVLLLFFFVLLSRSNDGCFADLMSSCQVINLFTFVFFIIIL